MYPHEHTVIKINRDVYDAIAKTHPIEHKIWEYLIKTGEGVIVET